MGSPCVVGRGSPPYIYFVSMEKYASIIFRQLKYCQTVTDGYISENKETASADSVLPQHSSHTAKLKRNTNGRAVQNSVTAVGRNRYRIRIPCPSVS